MPVVFEHGEARVGRVIKLCLLEHAQAGNLSSVGGLSSEGMEGFGASLGFYPMGQQAVQGKQPAQSLLAAALACYEYEQLDALGTTCEGLLC